mmetsp:Transcript_73017/g.173952  ORF Transcript_73017/g.173952 Transcript_73017/m.173952 type:complete len:336 (+) Transcript_73017:250-1257(+)
MALCSALLVMNRSPGITISLFEALGMHEADNIIELESVSYCSETRTLPIIKCTAAEEYAMHEEDDEDQDDFINAAFEKFQAEACEQEFATSMLLPQPKLGTTSRMALRRHGHRGTLTSRCKSLTLSLSPWKPLSLQESRGSAVGSNSVAFFDLCTDLASNSCAMSDSALEPAEEECDENSTRQVCTDPASNSDNRDMNTDCMAYARADTTDRYTNSAVIRSAAACCRRAVYTKVAYNDKLILCARFRASLLSQRDEFERDVGALHEIQQRFNMLPRRTARGNEGKLLQKALGKQNSRVEEQRCKLKGLEASLQSMVSALPTFLLPELGSGIHTIL